MPPTDFQRRAQTKQPQNPISFPPNFKNFTIFQPNAACANLATSLCGEMFFFSLLLLTVYQRF